MAEAKKTAVVKPAAKAVAAKTAETKTAEPKAEETKKTTVKKATAKTATAKTAKTTKAAAKKTTEKAARTPRKKAEVKTAVNVEFEGRSYATEDLVKIAKDIWQYDLNQKPEDLKTVSFYVKLDENKVYYVINDNVEGSFDI